MDNSKALEAAKRVAGPYMTALSNQQIDEVLREAVAAYEAALWRPTDARFEYLQSGHIGSGLEEKLNLMGEHGWELCHKNGMLLIFKRELRHLPIPTEKNS